MRTAELKRPDPRTHAGARSWTNVRAADYPNLRVDDGDTVTKFTWIFVGGEFHGQEVLPRPARLPRSHRGADRGCGTDDGPIDLAVPSPLHDRNCHLHNGVCFFDRGRFGGRRQHGGRGVAGHLPHGTERGSHLPADGTPLLRILKPFFGVSGHHRGPRKATPLPRTQPWPPLVRPPSVLRSILRSDLPLRRLHLTSVGTAR
jgi:hypothetical protein